jgi:membrane protease YdiL (CAAX protease family)
MLGLFLLIVVFFSLVATTATQLLAFATGTPAGFGMGRAAPGAILFAALTAAALAALVGYAFLVRAIEDRRVSELALRPAIPEIAIGLALGAAMMASTVLLMWACGWASLGRQPVASAWHALAVSVQSGVLEELLFRLVVFRLLWRAFGLWAALAVSALLFGFLHLMNPNASAFAAVCIALEAGVMLAAFYILTGRLWVSIGVHGGWNFTQGWIFGAAVSGTKDFVGGPLALHPNEAVSPIFSGGGFGPEASVAGLLVGTAVGLATLRLAWQRGRMRAEDDQAALSPGQD